jgi:tetratricopeptide (TPR) repeat protein
LEALAAQGLDTDELDSLVEQGLAREVDTETYDLHDLIREFLIRSLNDETRKDVHSKCSDWYRSLKPTPDVSIELIFHLTKCDCGEEAADLVVEQGREIVSQGHMELIGLIESIPLDNLNILIKTKLYQLRGEVLVLLGRFLEAEEILQQTKIFAESEGLTITEAEVLSALADIALKQGNSDDALSMHRDALEKFIELDDAKGAARSYNNMGYLLRRRNDKAKALEAYGEVEKILSQSDSQELLGSQLILARAFIELGEIDRARDHALTAFEKTDGIDDVQLHARAQAVLGRYYAKVGDSDVALHHYSSALDTMGDAGDLISLVEITTLLGEVLQDAGRTEEAMEHYREALVLAEANDLRMQIGELLSRLGGVATDKQRRMEYLQRALSVFRELGAKSRMQEVQAQVHRAVMSR